MSPEATVLFRSKTIISSLVEGTGIEPVFPAYQTGFLTVRRTFNMVISRRIELLSSRRGRGILPLDDETIWRLWRESNPHLLIDSQVS